MIARLSILGLCLATPLSSAALASLACPEPGFVSTQEHDPLYAFQPSNGKPWQFVDKEGVLVDGLTAKTAGDSGQTQPPCFSAGLVPSFANGEWTFFDGEGAESETMTKRRAVVELFSSEFEVLASSDQIKEAMLAKVSRRPNQFAGSTVGASSRGTVGSKLRRGADDSGQTQDYGLIYRDGTFDSWKALTEVVLSDGEGFDGILHKTQDGFLSIGVTDASGDLGLRLLPLQKASELAKTMRLNSTSVSNRKGKIANALVKNPREAGGELEVLEFDRFKNQHARVHSNQLGGWSLMDRLGSFALQKDYEDVCNFSDEASHPTPYKLDQGQWVFHHRTPESPVEESGWSEEGNSFERATEFRSGIAVVRQSSQWRWLNHEGRGTAEIEDVRTNPSLPVDFGLIDDATSISFLHLDDEGTHGRGLIKVSGFGAQAAGVGVIWTLLRPDGSVLVELHSFHGGKWKTIQPFDGPFASAHGSNAEPSFALFAVDGALMPR